MSLPGHQQAAFWILTLGMTIPSGFILLYQVRKYRLRMSSVTNSTTKWLHILSLGLAFMSFLNLSLVSSMYRLNGDVGSSVAACQLAAALSPPLYCVAAFCMYMYLFVKQRLVREADIAQKKMLLVEKIMFSATFGILGIAAVASYYTTTEWGPHGECFPHIPPVVVSLVFCLDTVLSFGYLGLFILPLSDLLKRPSNYSDRFRSLVKRNMIAATVSTIVCFVSFLNMTLAEVHGSDWVFYSYLIANTTLMAYNICVIWLMCGNDAKQSPQVHQSPTTSLSNVTTSPRPRSKLASSSMTPVVP